VEAVGPEVGRGAGAGEEPDGVISDGQLMHSGAQNQRGAQRVAGEGLDRNRLAVQLERAGTAGNHGQGAGWDRGAIGRTQNPGTLLRRLRQRHSGGGNECRNQRAMRHMCPA
jgi:hypothetical protein